MKLSLTCLKQSLLLLALVLPDLALGHPGHGEPGTAAHDMQHVLWLGFAVAVGIVALALAFRAARRRDDEGS